MHPPYQTPHLPPFAAVPSAAGVVDVIRLSLQQIDALATLAAASLAACLLMCVGCILCDHRRALAAGMRVALSLAGAAFLGMAIAESPWRTHAFEHHFVASLMLLGVTWLGLPSRSRVDHPAATEPGDAWAMFAVTAAVASILTDDPWTTLAAWIVVDLCRFAVAGWHAREDDAQPTAARQTLLPQLPVWFAMSAFVMGVEQRVGERACRWSALASSHTWSQMIEVDPYGTPLLTLWAALAFSGRLWMFPWLAWNWRARPRNAAARAIEAFASIPAALVVASRVAPALVRSAGPQDSWLGLAAISSFVAGSLAVSSRGAADLPLLVAAQSLAWMVAGLAYGHRCDATALVAVMLTIAVIHRLGATRWALLVRLLVIVLMVSVPPQAEFFARTRVITRIFEPAPAVRTTSETDEPVAPPAGVRFNSMQLALCLALGLTGTGMAVGSAMSKRWFASRSVDEEIDERPASPAVALLFLTLPWGATMLVAHRSLLWMIPPYETWLPGVGAWTTAVALGVILGPALTKLFASSSDPPAWLTQRWYAESLVYWTLNLPLRAVAQLSRAIDWFVFEAGPTFVARQSAAALLDATAAASPAMRVAWIAVTWTAIAAVLGWVLL